MKSSKDLEKCLVCQKTVYAMEKVSVEGKIFHEGCFKCTQCKKKLSPGTYTVVENTFYCLPHYNQLFTSKGNYSDGFGKERPTSGWAPSTATFEGPEHKQTSPTTTTTTAHHPPGPSTSGPGPRGPPGPPPPAPPPVDLTPAAGTDNTGAHAAALAAIASGGHKLKHVSKEERKKPPATSVVPGDVKPKKGGPTTTTTPAATIKKGPPETKLDSLKWTIRFHENQQENPITITITDKKQSVSIIDCTKSVIIIKGKSNNISLMNCSDCGVVFDDIIASVELVRCKKIQVQANGQVAQIIIDKTSGCDVFIQSEIGTHVEIVTSLTDSVNVNFPGPTPEDDPVEFPVPSQFESLLKNGKLVTKAVDHV